MESPPIQPRRGSGERAARLSVLVFFVLGVTALAFGFGYIARDLGDSDSSGKQGVAVSGDVKASADVNAAIVSEIIQILRSQYVDKSSFTDAQLRDAAIDGLIASLNDTHTEYLSPADIKAGALNLDSSYEGIGASVSDKNGPITIVAPFRDSPAEKAGVRAGDVVLSVDGERVDGWTKEEAVQRIRGPKGTSVKLEVKHTDGTAETLTIVRGQIPLQSVFTEPNLEVIPGESGRNLVDRSGAKVTDIAYVNISQFHDKTSGELRTALKEIGSNKNYKGLILDLRGNPGGLLSATVEVADEFLNSGTILSEVDANGKKQSWAAKSGGGFTKLPVVILLDKGSASGSEVLAGALHDNGRATIVGTRSFGKGTVNQLQELKNCGSPDGCGALYLSVGRWLSPNGEVIEGVGIKPDIELPMTYEQYLDQGDIQIFKAIEILHGQ